MLKRQNTQRKDKISIVISAFNEEPNILPLYKELVKVVDVLPVKETQIIFVDDGSTDLTYAECLKLAQEDKRIKVIHFSRNFGHEIAMTAGMEHASGDAVIFMDSDLQHPPKYIAQMVNLWQQGIDIVLTRRQDNLDTSSFYKFCAKLFYKVLNWLSDTKVMEKTPDFRLIDRKYIDFLKQFSEQDRLFRGLLSWIQPNEKLAYIDFTAPKRFAGESKYTFFKSLKLAITSLVQFSVKPLYLSLVLALFIGFLAILMGFYVIAEYFFLSHRTPGYATLMTTILFIGSLQLFMFAILGVYIAKIHLEVKKRPLYFANVFPSEEKHQNKKIKVINHEINH